MGLTPSASLKRVSARSNINKREGLTLGGEGKGSLGLHTTSHGPPSSDPPTPIPEEEEEAATDWF